jgi:O-antigen/teichoic acid export membrane protein
MATQSAPVTLQFGALRGLAARLSGGAFLRGSALFFLSATLVNVGNYAFNLLLGRWLGPAVFADVNLMVTLLLFVSFIAAALAMVTSRFTAGFHATGAEAAIVALRAWLNRVAWIGGGALGLMFALGAPLLREFFHVSSAWPFVILAAGVPVYLGLAVQRGVLQGRTQFPRLAASYQTEMWVRLALALGLALAGFAVNGVTAALTLSLAAAWLIARGAQRRTVRVGPAMPLVTSERDAITRFAVAAGGALAGQILINNSDVLIVKHFFPDVDAGHYAALALIGRIVFFATWSVVTTLFPIVAQKHARGEPHHHLLLASLGLVTAASAAIAGAAYLFPDAIIGMLFGAAYLPVAPLLWLYALATALYALANVVINYRLSANNKLGSVFVAAAGIAQVAALWLFHATLRDVVLIQIAIMSCLLVATLSWDLWLWRGERAKGRLAGE